VDKALTIRDVYVSLSSAKSTADANDSGVGGILGYTNHLDAVVVMERIVIEDSKLIGISMGAVVGYLNLGSISMTDIFFDIEFEKAEGRAQSSGIFGRQNTATVIQEVNVFGFMTNFIQGSYGVPLDPTKVLGTLDTLTQAWWDTN